MIVAIRISTLFTYTSRFRSLNVTAGPFTIGSDLDGGAIASGDVKSGSYETTSELHSFYFTVTSATREMIEAGTTSGLTNTEIYLSPPRGNAGVATSTDSMVH